MRNGRPRHYSGELGMEYTPVQRRGKIYLRFEDRVEYSLSEAVKLSRGAPFNSSRRLQEAYQSDIQAIHAIKSAIDGEIIAGPCRIERRPTTGYIPPAVSLPPTPSSARLVKDSESKPNCEQLSLFNTLNETRAVAKMPHY